MGRIKVNTELLSEMLYAHRKYNEIWTIENIADLFGVSTETIRNYINKAKKEQAKEGDINLLKKPRKYEKLKDRLAREEK